MESYYAYLSEENFIAVNNQTHDFNIQLNRTIELNETSSVEVLTCSYDCQGGPSGKIFYILCDVAQGSYFHGTEQPVIAVILPAYKKYERHYLNNHSKHRTVCGSTNRIRVYIRGRDLKDPSFKFSKLSLTLRFNNVRVK